jgi:hypothetical protein
MRMQSLRYYGADGHIDGFLFRKEREAEGFDRSFCGWRSFRCWINERNSCLPTVMEKCLAM